MWLVVYIDGYHCGSLRTLQVKQVHHEVIWGLRAVRVRPGCAAVAAARSAGSDVVLCQWTPKPVFVTNIPFWRYRDASTATLAPVWSHEVYHTLPAPAVHPDVVVALRTESAAAQVRRARRPSSSIRRATYDSLAALRVASRVGRDRISLSRVGCVCCVVAATLPLCNNRRGNARASRRLRWAGHSWIGLRLCTGCTAVLSNGNGT